MLNSHPQWAQILLNALMLLFLGSVLAFVLGMLRAGILMMGGLAAEPVPWFVACIVGIIGSSLGIVTMGTRHPVASTGSVDKHQ